MKVAITKISKEVDKNNGFLAVVSRELKRLSITLWERLDAKACKLCINESLSNNLGRGGLI